MSHASNKGTDQPAYSCSLIRVLYSMIPLVSLYPDFQDELIGLCFTRLEGPKDAQFCEFQMQITHTFDAIM